MTEHRDADGNLTGTSTTLSVWDDRARNEAFALVAWEDSRCPHCGNYDSRVPLPDAKRLVTWDDGQVYAVDQYRCLACGARDLIRRDFAARHEKDKPTPGRYMEADGRQFFARPADLEGGE